MYLILSKRSGLLPLKMVSNLVVGSLNISSLFNRFLCIEDIFLSPYSKMSPSIELDFLTDLLSAVETPSKSQKNPCC